MRFPCQGPLNTLVALAIAAAKATPVLLFFMHLKYRKLRLERREFAARLFWLVIFFGMTMVDYFSRNTLGVPGR